MATLTVFALVAEQEVVLWEAPMGDVEILVALFPDSTISCTRAVDGLIPLIVTFSKYDESLGALLREWTLVAA